MVDGSVPPSLNTLPAAREKYLQRTGESSPLCSLLNSSLSLCFLPQDPAAASISDGDCDAREGESVAMNYKPSPLQVKLGECVWGVRDMWGVDRQGALGWVYNEVPQINQLRLADSKTPATKSLAPPGTLSPARPRGKLQFSTGAQNSRGISEAKKAPGIPGDSCRGKSMEPQRVGWQSHQTLDQAKRKLP